MKLRFAATALTAAMLLSACTRRNDEFAETISDTIVTEKTTVSVTSAVTTVYETTQTEEQAPQTEIVTEPSAGEIVVEKNSVYDFPDEFYVKLEEIIESYDHFLYYDISLAYYDIETGFSLLINPDKHYYSASVMKAPYMLYIYRLALSGEADLDEKLVYTEDFKREGTGVLKEMEFGTEFTIEELIGYCLEESDNSAFAMLRKKFPEEGYVEYIKSLGVNHTDDAKAFNQPQLCGDTALIFSEAVYSFIEEENPYSENLRYHMTHSRNAMIYGGEGDEVVRKYGWHGGNFHDMAVVYGEKPYLLTIMTNLDMLEIEYREYCIFRDLSKLIAEYSDTLAEADGEGDRIVIQIPRMEVDEMNLPKDPYMLLSVLNMKLRDSYKSFDALCEDMDCDAAEITAAMEKLGYVYDEKVNQFAPIPEETEKPQE
ncbi:MAG: serine hydrolase [Oscillospiraceae bacterium]|nr:serine hydrolase [Oscillospiraceae bacterium]